ncbi:hypothetical protein BDQ12DRAFT_730072 [Crucibulum laeve]|uniref:Uncharacterized protein n=1 Tax=Crucibulum laeve TaxID=68775 RepID=A0A5C3LEA5_9AGAR|nr:hypothetical protein BDQ12DRAFT_730072 [Crucibulum laeve]
MSHGPQITQSAFKYFFGMTFQDVEDKYYSVGIDTEPIIRPPSYVTTKSQRTPRFHPWTEEENTRIFSLEDRGFTLPPPDIDDGSDNDDMDIDDDEEEHLSLDDRLSVLWRQFLQDLMMKCPNPKGRNESYCRLTILERSKVNEDVYMNKALSEIFNACQWKYAKTDDIERAFNYYWPVKTHQLPHKSQGYRQCRWYQDWKRLMDEVNGASATIMRKEIWKRFKKLLWVPVGTSDKIWVSKGNGVGFERLPRGSEGAAPQIYTWFDPLW